MFIKNKNKICVNYYLFYVMRYILYDLSYGHKRQGMDRGFINAPAYKKKAF